MITFISSNSNVLSSPSPTSSPFLRTQKTHTARWHHNIQNLRVPRGLQLISIQPNTLCMLGFPILSQFCPHQYCLFLWDKDYIRRSLWIKLNSLFFFFNVWVTDHLSKRGVLCKTKLESLNGQGKEVFKKWAFLFTILEIPVTRLESLPSWLTPEQWNLQIPNLQIAFPLNHLIRFCYSCFVVTLISSRWIKPLGMFPQGLIP